MLKLAVLIGQTGSVRGMFNPTRYFIPNTRSKTEAYSNPLFSHSVCCMCFENLRESFLPRYQTTHFVLKGQSTDSRFLLERPSIRLNR